MKKETTILLVEDDQNLGSLVEEGLRSEGYKVLWHKEGQSAFSTFDPSTHDICLLDIMLPDLDGFELAKKIRERSSQVPILFLTAKELPEDRLKGFESGGDDYITKPFLMKELLFRIEVFLRRSQNKPREIPVQNGKNWSLQAEKLSFTYKEEAHNLTKREFEVLEFLLQNHSRIVPREEILFNIWGDDDYFMGRSLDVFITRLRSLLKKVPEIDILNVRGVGFRLELKPE